jgi:enoyl-CoA hydratase
MLWPHFDPGDSVRDELVRYELEDGNAWLRFDDGKANVISPASIGGFNTALDRAEKGAKVVVIAGRPGRFSAGFDLSVMGQGGDAVVSLVRGGAELATRLYSFPLPVIAAVTGHALAMGAVLLMSVDERVAVEGESKIGLNETAIGMTLPEFARILARERLSPTHLTRATANAEIYTPLGAIEAGFVDRVVPADRLEEVVRSRAQTLAALDGRAHGATKLALRATAIEALRESTAAFTGMNATS